MRSPTVLSASLLFALAGASLPAHAQALRVVTDATGTYLQPSPRPPLLVPGPAAGTRSLLWSSPDPIAIAEYVSLSPFSQSAWVGQWLNSERLQRFPITGPGVATFESPAGGNSPSIVSAAAGADLAVFIDQPNAPAPGTLFQARAYRAAGGAPVWTREFPDIYTSCGGLKVCRDGSTVAVIFTTSAPASTVYFLEGATGATRQNWSGETGTVGSVDLTDDGAQCFLQYSGSGGAVGKLVSTATAAEAFSAFGSGSGSRYQVSGDGSVLVVGGFSFYVFKRVGPTYTQIINFTAPTSWFGWGSAVSRDGTTVGVMSHNYGANYLQTATRLWDITPPTPALLGTYSTAGSGGLQDSIVGGVLSDHGARFAVASWGTADNIHPEVMVFDRTVSLIDSLDTPGSPFGLDLSGDGRYTLVGTKSIHANALGNGGTAYMLDSGAPGGGGGCYANCDGSTQPPVANVADFTCFLQKFASNDPYANCDASTTPPVINVADFTCFLQKFAAGCP